MLKKILIYTLFFYFSALLQTTFFASLEAFGIINIILVSVILINFFEKPTIPTQIERYSGIYAGFIGGFFLDIFSANLIGQNILISLALALFIKLVLKKYVRVPTV